MFLHRVSSFPLIFPKQSLRNLVICVSGLGGSKQNTALITDTLTDLNYLDAGTQCFPLYYYEKKAISQPTLFDSAASGEYTRKDAITDFIFEKAKSIYGPKVTKEDMKIYGIDIDAFVFFCLLCIIFTLLIVEKKRKIDLSITLKKDPDVL